MSGGASSNQTDQVTGQQALVSPNSDLNRNAFHFDQLDSERRTHFTAKIVAVHNRNSLTEPCTVDIQPTVKQQDGLGKTSSHGTVYGISVPRNQSGDSVIVNDPQVGDTATFSVLDRDHSQARNNDWKEAAPGSFRRSSLSDAVFGSVMPRKAQEVKQFIRFDDAQGGGGMTIQDRNGNSLVSNKADGWNLNGVKIDTSGNITSPGNVTAGKGTADQVDLQGHAHGNSGPPTPGT
ncbi:hypothetical protein R1A27_34395 (plasmid) [Methylobacterium sp. NMS12]|uniref:hypothetical protein n=1 Tax=Methylobacterium sp. NMS12 TaxID=3079766 RepID=UPI003F883E22